MSKTDLIARAVSEICGDEMNCGLVRDLAYTVWVKCHNPTHEDGNTDWGSDTLPLVNIANERVRQALATARAEGRAEGMREAAEVARKYAAQFPAYPEFDALHNAAADVGAAILAAVPDVSP